MENQRRRKKRKDAELGIKVKLPKLATRKFKGNHLDWMHFWSQFETEIDRSSSLSPVAKLSYQK